MKMNKIFNFSFLVSFAFLIFSCKKENPQIITETSQKQTEVLLIRDTIKIVNALPVQKKMNLPFEIEGDYTFTDDVANCKLILKLFYENDQLKYILETNTKTVADEAEISKNENDGFYITFKNIEWAVNDGFIDPEGNSPEENLPLPTEIMAGIRDNQIIFQNYGNAENHYVILEECDVKYIYLTKE